MRSFKLTPWIKRQLTRALAMQYESAERALSREMEQADRENPEWDLASRISTCAGAIERGVSAKIVRAAYGERIYRAATLPGG
jgi:hypothetical protein